MNELIYWIWLSLGCRPATDTFIKLYRHAEGAKAIFELSDEQILHLVGKRKREAELLLRRDLAEAERVLCFCERKGIGIVTFADDAYPPLLKTIQEPPVLLYYRGTLPDFTATFPIGMVGTRTPSEYGRRSAFHIALDLARCGGLVVSGMARGIDGVALAAAVAVGAPCVAVLGCGIDICYPPEHLTLARAIVERGCILTEYPPGTPPLSYHFPQRNRIISGMCAATAVFEGQEQSGSLITARCAMRQGRTVYALPGNIDQPNSRATGLLLRDGARPILSADDVIRDFEYVYTGILNPFLLCEPVSVAMEPTIKRLCVAFGSARGSRRIPRHRRDAVEPAVSEAPVVDVGARTCDVPRADMTDDERTVYDRIPTDGACDIEALTQGDIPVHRLMHLLFGLELKGCIELLPGERVQRT